MGVVILVVLLIVVGIAMLIGRAAGVRPNMGFPLGLLTLFVLAASWPPGWVDVQIACRRDGGVRGSPPKIEGFWYARDVSHSDCNECERLVMTGEFRYVDYRAGRTSAKASIQEGQFYRVSLGQEGDARCFPNEYVDTRDLPTGRCVLLTPLPSAPSEGYRYTSRVTALSGLLGSRLRKSSSELVSLETNKAVVTNRRYDYGSPLNRWLTGGGDILYSCPRNALNVDEFKRLFSHVSDRE